MMWDWSFHILGEVEVEEKQIWSYCWRFQFDLTQFKWIRGSQCEIPPSPLNEAIEADYKCWKKLFMFIVSSSKYVDLNGHQDSEHRNILPSRVVRLENGVLSPRTWSLSQTLRCIKIGRQFVCTHTWDQLLPKDFFSLLLQSQVCT